MSTTHRAQRIWLTLAICIFSSLSTTSALTYYIADSCNPYPIIPYLMTNATSTISNTGRRNNFKNLDPAFQTAFKTIFKTEQSSQQNFDIWGYYGTASSILAKTTSLLGGLQRTYDQDPSDIRIVCDNDTYGSPNDRWQLTPDWKLPPNIQSGTAPKPNSERTPGVDQEFFDQVNFVKRATASLGCQRAGVAATTYMYSLNPFDFNGRPAPEDLPARRTVISVCPRILDKSITPYQTWDDLPLNYNYIESFPDDDIWNSMPMLVMCHELRHISQIRFVDVAGAASYDWTNIMRLNDLNSLTNADNHKHMDILAHLENVKYRLNSITPQNGGLQYDRSIIG